MLKRCVMLKYSERLPTLGDEVRDVVYTILQTTFGAC